MSFPLVTNTLERSKHINVSQLSNLKIWKIYVEILLKEPNWYFSLLFYNLGAIQIKNWKPLTFDTITENPDATVDEILGDLTSVATLRIKLGRYDTALVWFLDIALHTTITKITHMDLFVGNIYT